MTRVRRVLMLGAVLAAAVASAPASASASSLPKLYNGTVYKVRPHTVVLAEAYGGNLELTWQSWSGSLATGMGTSTASGMGSTTVLNVTVKASRVRNGRFTRFTVTTKGSNGAPDVEKLHLSANGWIG